MRKLLLVFVPAAFILGCGRKSTINHAQEHMHASSFEDLVQRFEDSTRAEWQKPDEVIAFMAVDSNDVIADIGAGTGYFSFAIAEKANKVIAIDIDDNFINYLQGQKAIKGAENVEVRKSEADAPELEDLECTKIVIVNTVHHFEKVAKYLNKCRKALRFGGSLYIIDFKEGDLPVGPPNDIKLPLNDLKRELGLAGFHNLTVETELLPYQYVVKAN
ncbi:MAG: class I SAM-dependent methyltransferase [Bacteroidia bacterium]